MRNSSIAQRSALYSRNTTGYCSHNDREQKKYYETFSTEPEARLWFPIKKCVYLLKTVKSNRSCLVKPLSPLFPLNLGRFSAQSGITLASDGIQEFSNYFQLETRGDGEK